MARSIPHHKHIKPNQEEVTRLEQEKLTEISSIGRIHRVLIPIRARGSLKHLKTIDTIKSTILQNISKVLIAHFVDGMILILTHQ